MPKDGIIAPVVMTWTARALTDEEHEVVRSNGKAAATLIEDELLIPSAVSISTPHGMESTGC